MPKILKKAALLIGAILFALVLGEVVVRCLPTNTLGFEFTSEGFKRPREYEPDTTRNKLGFHDVEVGTKQPGTKRIVLLGDSYVALRLPLSDTIGRRLAHHTKLEVVACGRGGWGQRQQLNTLQQLGEHLAPDIVLTLILPFNDIRDNSQPLTNEFKRQWQRIRVRRPGWAEFSATDAPYLWLPQSALNRLISHRLASRTQPHEEIPLDYLVYEKNPDPRWQQAWTDTEQLLLQTRDLSVKLGARYAVVSASTPHGVLGAAEGLEHLMQTYPAMSGREWDLDGPNARLAEFCKANQIPFVSLEPTFRERTQRHGERLHWEFNGHWNPAGNDLAGRLMAEFLRAQKW